MRSIDESFQQMVSKRYAVDFTEIKSSKSLFESLDECDKKLYKPESNKGFYNKGKHKTSNIVGDLDIKSLHNNYNKIEKDLSNLAESLNEDVTNFDKNTTFFVITSEPGFGTITKARKLLDHANIEYKLITGRDVNFNNVSGYPVADNDTKAIVQKNFDRNDIFVINSRPGIGIVSKVQDLFDNAGIEYIIKDGAEVMPRSIPGYPSTSSNDESLNEATDEESTLNEYYDFSDELWNKLPHEVKISMNDAWDNNKTNINFFEPYLKALVDAKVITEDEKTEFIKSNDSYGYKD